MDIVAGDFWRMGFGSDSDVESFSRHSRPITTFMPSLTASHSYLELVLQVLYT